MGWLRTALSFTFLCSPVPSGQSSQAITTHLEWPCSRPDGQRGPSWSLTLHAFVHPQLLLDTFIHNLPNTILQSLLYFILLYSIVGYCNLHWIILIAIFIIVKCKCILCVFLYSTPTFMQNCLALSGLQQNRSRRFNSCCGVLYKHCSENMKREYTSVK